MTPRPLTVAFDGPVTAARHAPVLAGLPGHFRTAESGAPADILVVDGTTTVRPAAAPSTGAILVDRPRAGLGQLPDTAMVFADTGYAADPAWATELPRIRDSLTQHSAGVVESTVAVTDAGELADALFWQLTLVRALLGTVDFAPSAVAPGRGHVLTGAAGSAVVSLSGTVGSPGLTLDTIGPSERWHVAMHPPGTARPAVISRFDGEGRHTTRPRFESPRRALWRSVHATLNGTAAPRHLYADVLADLATSESLLAAPAAP
ncbi:hypothetical protein ACFYO2_05305 [Streptomyces sp. NPDC006602]|uniref:hypothetical protein n=1 Tax=Streptomyces sp. NPDC006602 TaxID=3364751 RepID=UPI00369E8E12